MRAMILAAGYGTRLRPLTDYRAKPALPIRGRAVISLLLDFLSRHDFEEVMINLHYLPQTIRNAVEADCPKWTKISWSEEHEPLGTGGGIRRAANFLSGVDPCVVLAGDMLLDLDLGLLVRRHEASQREATLILREDSRGQDFGTIGVDAAGHVMRVGHRLRRGIDTDSEFRSGLFAGVRIFSKQAFAHWPEAIVFEDLRDWLMPGIESNRLHVGAEFVDSSDSVWEPVGTPSEYLSVNLSPPEMPSLGGRSDHWAGDIEIVGKGSDVILGAHSALGAGVDLERVVVWEEERVPAGLRARDGVFAAGRFHVCGPMESSGGLDH